MDVSGTGNLPRSGEEMEIGCEIPGELKEGLYDKTKRWTLMLIDLMRASRSIQTDLRFAK